MARRASVIGVLGIAAIALASAAGASDKTAATSKSTSPEAIDTQVAPATTRVATTTTSTTEPPPSSTTSTSTSTSTTTSTSSTTSTSTTTTVAKSTGPFNGAAFDAVIAAATVDKGDISAGAAVMRDGDVLHTGSYGMEDPFQAIPATADTEFRIASISKMFTAVAVMQLVDEGSISLDQSFTKQLGLDGPFSDPRIATVTVRQLLSHTSGFTAAHNIFFAHGVDTWQQAADDAIDNQLLMFDPGTGFQYSNTNFCLLGMLLESVTGDPFDRVIRERVLGPIGIKAHLAPTFDTEKGDALHASSPGRNYMETLGPAGGWVTSPEDIAELASALRNESADVHLLDEATVDAMRTRVSVPVEVPPPLNGWSYGLGLILFGDGSWGHTGTIESTHAIVVNRPDGLTVSVMVSGEVPRNTDDLVAVIDLAVAAAST